MAARQDNKRQGPGVEDFLAVLRERAWVIVLCVVVAVGVSVFFSLGSTVRYQASSNLVPLVRNASASVIGSDYYSYYYDPQTLRALDLAVLTIDPAIAEAVKVQLNSNRSAAELAGMVTVNSDTRNQVITMTAVSPYAQEAADVANAFADQFIVYRRDADRAAIASARDLLQQRIDSLSPEDKQSEYGLLLQDKYENLLLLESVQDGGYRVIRRAEVPGAPIPSGTTRDILLALGVGLVLGVVIALLIELLDKRIKDEKDLEQVCDLPVLASVPTVDGKWLSAKKGKRSEAPVGFEGPGAGLLESFRLLRSSLQYFDVEGGLRTIMLTSGLPEEGKTTTTVNLGISLALSGKRVIVLESDLRRPMVHEYFQLENEVGLSTVLAGRVPVERALKLVRMDPFIPQRARRDPNEPSTATLRKNLYCLPSGPLPPNPAELLGSARMGEVIAELESLADYVLVDTSPVLPVSDAVTVARWVDAVILTVRLRSTTRQDLQEVCQLLERTGTRIIGVVACGSKAGKAYYGKRAYEYAYSGQAEA
jgi:receptor protein-tyrosine kinase